MSSNCVPNGDRTACVEDGVQAGDAELPEVPLLDSAARVAVHARRTRSGYGSPRRWRLLGGQARGHERIEVALATRARRAPGSPPGGALHLVAHEACVVALEHAERHR